MLREKGCGAFWASGRLSALEQACLASFPRAGVELTLFSYEPIPNVPAGVRTADAAEVVPFDMTQRFLYDGRPDLSHFSDLFRYEMIRRRDLVWVDADVMVIGRVPDLPHPDVVVEEAQGGINGAVLYLAEDDLRSSVKRRVDACMDRPLRWGETGPAVIAGAVAERDRPTALYGHEIFYPIEHYDLYRVLLPELREGCEVACRDAVTLHLFNNILTTMGYWKQIAPPEGSFLHAKLAELDLLGLFDAVYPARIMDAMVQNFRFRQNGKALGVKSIVREFVPSIGRTFRHYRK